MTRHPFLLSIAILLVLPTAGDAAPTSTCYSPAGMASILPLGPLNDGPAFGQLKDPSGPSANDFFGWEVAIDDDTLVATEVRDDHAAPGTSCNSGAAYVFRRHYTANGVRWSQEAKLVADDAACGEAFGESVGVDGDRLIVGAQAGGGSDLPGSFGTVGAAYVFLRDDNGTPSDPTDDTWSQEQKLMPAVLPESGDRYGYSVAIRGDVALVGAWGDNTFTGSVYVFRLDDNGTPGDPSDDSWNEEQNLTASDGAPFDWFGITLARSDDWILIGAQREEDVGFDAGAAYLFRWNGASWVQDQKVVPTEGVIPGGEHRYFAGDDVDLTNDRFVASGLFYGDLFHAGAAYVFRRDDSGTPLDESDDTWIEEDRLVASDASANDELSVGVGFAGDLIAVGAHQDDDDGSNSGSVYIYRRDDNGTPANDADDFWGLQPGSTENTKIRAWDATAGDFFGQQLAASSNYVVVSSPPADARGIQQSGSTYVFVMTPECCDGLDNDSDGSTDHGSDTDCTGTFDLSEATNACSDGIDNDLDGEVDYPEDGCLEPGDLTEERDCGDGIDNDGDGAVDLADLACNVAASFYESPQCQDGLDNDGDAMIDCDGGAELGVNESVDPQCAGRCSKNREKKRSCGLGFEPALILILVAARCRRLER